MTNATRSLLKAARGFLLSGVCRRKPLYAAHVAGEGYKAVVISSEGTNVFIMCLALNENTLFQKCGSRTQTGILHIGNIEATVGREVCKALTGMHAYTGCDTVSAFAGKGKASALKILTSNKESQDTFGMLGQEWDLSPDLR